MEALLEKTTKEDQRIAKSSMEKLDRRSRELVKSRGEVEISLHKGDEFIKVPQKAVRLLYNIVSNMAAGKSVALVLSDENMSTQEAADFLNVSRPHVVKLLENGEIPYTRVGSHRRIEFSDLLVYHKKIKANRSKQLDLLGKQAQKLNMGY